ncbi:hypothetical protein ACFVHW_11500 [Streptomyces sp. NPDC127110]|uniref:hypothetical protein n=1 Tax=Streptomyces sp. NPDC127110 TaxID=3345362 RepID=UPI003639044B
MTTQAINRGMSLEAIAALLGHRSSSMTRVHARIADRTVADENFAVSMKVEALYDTLRRLPADAEGTKVAKLRRECTAGCSATATAHAPSRWTATSSRSASPARSSSPPSNSAPTLSASGTMRQPRNRSPASRSSTGYSADWMENRPAPSQPRAYLRQFDGRGRS